VVTFVLASRSPRRREILVEAGFVFEVVPPDDGLEDDPLPNELPSDYVKRLALWKAENVLNKIDRGIVIGCDTVVVCNDEIIGKPTDRSDAARMLRMLRGTLHYVQSGLCLCSKPNGIRRVADAVSTLRMIEFTDDELEEYLDSEAWRGKAGAFGLQDSNGWANLVDGSESNVVGLPLELLKQMIESNEFFLVRNNCGRHASWERSNVEHLDDRVS